MKTCLDASILPAGYVDWNGARFNNQTFMATYADFGPGYDLAAEKASNRTIVLDKKAVSPYDAPVHVFADEDGTLGNVWWVDQSVLAKR